MIKRLYQSEKQKKKHTKEGSAFGFYSDTGRDDVFASLFGDLTSQSYLIG